MTFSFLRRPKAPPGNTGPEGEESGKGSELQKKAPGGSRPQRRRRSLGLTRGEASVDCVDHRGRRGGEADRPGRKSLGSTRGEWGALAQAQGQESTQQKTSQGGNGQGSNGQGVFARALTRSLTSPKNGRLPHARDAPMLAKQLSRCAGDLATSLPRDVWEAAEQDSLTAWGTNRNGNFPEGAQLLPARSKTLSNGFPRPEAAPRSPRAGEGAPPSLNLQGGNTAPAEGPGGVSQVLKGCLKKSASDPLRERARPRHRRSTCMESIDLEGMVEGMGIGGEGMVVGGMGMEIGGEDKARMVGGPPEARGCRGQSPGLDQFCSGLSRTVPTGQATQFCSGLSSEQLVPHSAPLLGLLSQDKWVGFVVGDASLTFCPSGASDWSSPQSGGRGMASSLVLVDSLDVRMRHTPSPSSKENGADTIQHHFALFETIE